jgi:Pyruvate/2-oxoacid:ferredoxin oxidoreductase delta subunit
MKIFFLLLAIPILLISASDCRKKTSAGTLYKGRLEIKAICYNYTISVLEGDMDTSKVVANWTDENTGKSYKNVFKLDAPCNFPATINQGDEFYFRIDTAVSKGCIVCMAYYPVPPKAIPIVVEK